MACLLGGSGRRHSLLPRLLFAEYVKEKVHILEAVNLAAAVAAVWHGMSPAEFVLLRFAASLQVVDLGIVWLNSSGPCYSTLQP